MEKEELERIAQDSANQGELKRFDIQTESSLLEPSADFTKKVMGALPGPNATIGLHIWGILLGVALVLIIWAVGGFNSPTISLDLDVLEESVDLTQMTRAFMIANGLLILLLVDRIVQKRKRVI